MFIRLVDFTDRGIRNVKETPVRYQAFREMAAKLGVAVTGVDSTVGRCDLLVVTEGSDEAVTADLANGFAVSYREISNLFGA